MVEIEQPALLAICALLADGHLLIEDVPGVGKTTLARSSRAPSAAMTRASSARATWSAE